ncbi:MAG: hyaD [Mycobacterium sp.]|nr:hyaD [Mycobacterium sp.]
MTPTQPRPIPLTDGRFTVPGNRWDLLDSLPSPTPTVAVIVPFYNQHHELDLVLRALELQHYPAGSVSVVVADDGSEHSPQPRPGVQVVRQDDLGFRAAAVRNLGASVADAEILCFLDADTVPEPDYLRRIVRLPALAPEALVVGHRRHADFGDWVPAQLDAWWSGGPAPHLVDAPRWLSAEYERSGNLLHLDHRSYRYVISSVMCCSTALFDELGGFDESFAHYGGEDWEFAHRALVGGAVLHHAVDAVAWHNGPDWAGRDVPERVAAKNAEALALARRITDPDARSVGLRYAIPDVVVRVDPGDAADGGHTAGSLLATVSCFLGLDVGIWVCGPGAEELLAAIGAEDQRLQAGSVPEHVRRSCRFIIDVTGRAVLPAAAIDEILTRCAASGVGAVEVSVPGARVLCRSSWSVNRIRRWSTGDVRLADPEDAAQLHRTLTVGGTELGLRCGPVVPDLSW